LIVVPLNTDCDGCAVTITCAHHFAGNIVTPRQGFREGGGDLSNHHIKDYLHNDLCWSARV